MIRKIVYYTGRVQGVGFRATTANLAGRYRIAGYVQNLPDGRVRLEVQGDRDQVEGLLNEVKQAMASNITTQDLTDAPPDDKLGDPSTADAFGVRY